MSVTPADAVNKYLHIPVFLEQQHTVVNVRVHRYACSHVGYGNDQRQRREYKDRLYQATRGDHLGLTATQFVDVFTGKGRPEYIARCLRMAGKRQIYFHDGPAMGSPALTPEQGIQRVADEYIGLDCNGFVGNWGIMAGVHHADPQLAPLDWLGHGPVRANLSEVADFDVIVWADGTHIAVINHVQSRSGDHLVASVGESAWGGTHVHDFTFRMVHTPFSAQRHGRTFESRIVIQSAPHHNPGGHVLIAQMSR